MKTRNAPTRLAALLARALDRAMHEHLPDVGEAILCALEAHAAATGHMTTLDAAYLRAVLGPGVSVPGALRGARRKRRNHLRRAAIPSPK